MDEIYNRLEKRGDQEAASVKENVENVEEQSAFVYILKCSDDSLYTGWTRDLRERLKAHNLGKGAKYTRGRRPVEMVYWESCVSRGQALHREAEIKKLKKAQKIKLISKQEKK